MNKAMILKFYKSSFVRFGVVGFLGMICNLIVFYIFSHIFLFSVNISAIMAFVVAVTENYYLNHIWSFKAYVDLKPNSTDYFKYVLVNLVGLGVNIFVLNLLLYFFVNIEAIVAQLFGIVVGMAFNYFGSRLYVFIKKSNIKIG